MNSIPEWLPNYVRAQMARQIGACPSNRILIAQAGGMRLYGTIGAEVFLRPDGTTVAFLEEWPGREENWIVESTEARLGSLSIAAEQFPEVRALLPPRPEHAAACIPCTGSGRVQGIVCGECHGLGWCAPAAT